MSHEVPVIFWGTQLLLLGFGVVNQSLGFSYYAMGILIGHIHGGHTLGNRKIRLNRI